MNNYEFIKKHLDDSVDEKYSKNCQKLLDFIEKTYELAFGDDAINKGYTDNEVLTQLKEFSDKALILENNE